MKAEGEEKISKGSKYRKWH